MAEADMSSELKRLPRPWCHLHTSTYVVLCSALTFLALINIPGNSRGIVENFDGYFQFRQAIVHGWPMTFLRRSDSTEDPTAIYGWRQSSFWNLNDSDREFFSLGAFVIDALSAASIVIVLGSITEWRSRRRQGRWQFSVAQLLFLIVCFSALFGYFLWIHNGYQSEARVEHEIQSRERDGYGYGSWQRFYVAREPRGWSWLEQVLDTPAIFDRVAEVQVVPPDSLGLISQWEHVRKLTVAVPLDVDSGLQLDRLQRLEALEIAFQIRLPIESIGETTLEQYQRRIANALHSLVPLPNLRFLEVQSDISFGDSLHALVGVNNVEVLALSGFEMTNDDLAHLPLLDSVRELYLRGDKVTNSGVRVVTHLPGLRALALTSQQIDDGALEVIAQLEALQELWLAGTAVKGPGLASLRQLKNLEAVGLNPRCADIEEAAKLLPGVQAYNH